MFRKLVPDGVPDGHHYVPPILPVYGLEKLRHLVDAPMAAFAYRGQIVLDGGAPVREGADVVHLQPLLLRGAAHAFLPVGLQHLLAQLLGDGRAVLRHGHGYGEARLKASRRVSRRVEARVAYI